MIRVIQVLVNTATMETVSRNDVTHRFKGQWIGMKEITHERQNKEKVLNGEGGNVYYEIVGVPQ